MSRRCLHIFRPSFIRLLLPLASVVLLAALSRESVAQEMRGMAVEGYITALHLPAGFDVNGQQVALQTDTTYGKKSDRVTATDNPWRDHVEVGAYVFVLGSNEHKTKTALARTVLFRDDWDRKFVGLGVIDRVISSGPEPVFRADGFPVRITAATETSFHGDLKTLADVGVNTWLRYEGKRDKEGILVAAKARFMRVKAKPLKTVNGIETYNMHFEAPDTASGKDGQIMLGAIGTWYKIPANRILQERVARVGMSLVPAYQRQLPEDDPFKIHFHFYALEDDKLRGELCSMHGGLILIPMHLLDRMKNDSQLAAVLADGIAFTVQQQATRLLIEERVALGMEAASLALIAFSPAVALDLAINGAMPNTKEQMLMEEQRGRVALALMTDAGYDPRQAPEAWRLVQPKHLPKDVGSLKYPDRSGYQLGILDLQYKTAKDETSHPVVPTAAAVLSQ